MPADRDLVDLDRARAKLVLRGEPLGRERLERLLYGSIV